MGDCPTPRITRIIPGIREAIEIHARDCGDRIAAIALNPVDHAALSIAEIWGLPVLAWGEVEPEAFKVLCEASGTLIPDVDNPEELMDRWKYHLRPGDSPSGSVAA